MVPRFDTEGQEMRWVGPHEVLIKVFGLPKNGIPIQKNRPGGIKIDYDFSNSGTPPDIAE